ncbi:MAG: hypothetical protein HYU36_10100 [Planctomycetes bacterium]|nr:hypothetical protein [Planctomycetota bacterium]
MNPEKQLMNRSARLSLWMRFGQPLEPVLERYTEIFDGWQAGGVRGVALGRLYFTSSAGRPVSIPAFTPNPLVYRDLGVEPPAPPAEDLPEKRRKLHAALGDAKRRGFEIYVFCPSAGAGPGGSGHPLVDERTLAAEAARIRDVMEQFPEVDGGILDGPEFGYEIAPGHRSNIFQDLPEGLRPLAHRLGIDFDAVAAARDRFQKRLQSLRPSDIDLHGAGGLLGGHLLFGHDPGLAAWLAFRRDALMDYFRRLRTALRTISRPVRMGLSSRTACFAPLNGYDFAEVHRHYDFHLPKHYFYHRGFDGLYGTVGRALQTLTAWNPGLSDDRAMRVVESLFGIRMPWVRSRFDLDLGFPPEFFEGVVVTETRRALAAAPDPSRVVPWIDAGREPHDGDPVPAGDLYRILEAAASAGLQRFLYHSHTHLTESEWAVISRLCGESWLDGKPGYAPPDGIPWESMTRRGLT